MEHKFQRYKLSIFVSFNNILRNVGHSNIVTIVFSYIFEILIISKINQRLLQAGAVTPSGYRSRNRPRRRFITN